MRLRHLRASDVVCQVADSPWIPGMKRWFVIVLISGEALLRGLTDTPKAPHWAFQPVRHPEPPAVTNAAWCRTPLDRFILARLEADGISPAMAADRRALIRRASFDLTGLPPSADAVDAFVADRSPNAFATLIDRLLESPRYGEHWGRHWLDVVRYADTAGETADYPVPVAWRYRNYVIDAFNADKPYNEFLREQIAGDILARRGPRDRYAERVTATGYLAISRRFGFDSENYHHLTLQDTIDTVGQSVLGLTLGCARCHAHKFDPVSMPDYYALYGIFDSTRYAFPGSEQKQKTRALAPLIPPEESLPQWRAFESRIAGLAAMLEQQKQAVPSAVLRSLDDIDGDFELQAPAAGGSNGVLVPPWVYEGPIAVTTDAQSPFKNAHPLGRVGASVSGATNGYRIAQALHPARNRSRGGRLHVNLDFRVGTNDPATRGRHRFWLGTFSAAPAVEVLLGQDVLTLRTGNGVETLHPLQPGRWQNLQLELDLDAGTVAGRVGAPGNVVALPARPLAVSWPGNLEVVALDSAGSAGVPLPPVMVDNLAVQEAPLSPVSTTVAVPALASGTPDPATLTARLQELADMDGDLELQTVDAPPAFPWNPGPRSVVKLRAEAQSPFRNFYPDGDLGIRLPNSGDYNGFGQALSKRRDAAHTDRLFVSFDIRCSDAAAGAGGSWRYYLGHGPGTSAAVELFINGTGFFRRSGDARDPVSPLTTGEWYQVQLTLDLKQKHYTGSIASASGLTEFSGASATGWDGIIDHTFIDSYGHLGGVKPALDADNFVLRETPLPGLDATPVARSAGERESRRAQVTELRQQLAQREAAADAARRELNSLLAEGPFELAYAVSEGTPRNARLQLRGEPDKPGDEVPRGFPGILGGGPLPPTASGSGRLELADWLVNPSNPLTARVMVNRIWQYHFGQGLVKTPNDFGARGLPPTHPDLLDHLATEFIRCGWSIKAMHRLIMGSAVYQQESRWTSGGRSPGPGVRDGEDCPLVPDASVDSSAAVSEFPATEYFSPFPRRRLGAEETRDAILLTSGTLEPGPGGAHPFPSPTDWGYTQHGPFSAVYEHNRRSVYLMTQRIKRHPFLALFDGADPNSSTAERRVTTVPTQALFFLNDPFVHASAEQFASRVLAGAGPEADSINAAYRRALGRSATPTEQTEAAAFLSAYRTGLNAPDTAAVANPAMAAFARVLFGSNEFLTVD